MVLSTLSAFHSSYNTQRDTYATLNIPTISMIPHIATRRSLALAITSLSLCMSLDSRLHN